jgi:hypothetical protein
MYCIVIDFIRYQAYILVAVYKLLEEVDIHRLKRGKVDLAIAEQEVVELLLGFHLGAEFVDVDLWVRHDRAKGMKVRFPYRATGLKFKNILY